MVDPLEEAFPGLARGGYRVTSPANKDYNCIAYAAGDTEHWWWPAPPDVTDAYWPQAAPRAETVEAFRAAFNSLGYTECANEDLEPGFEKVAIFADSQGIPLHAARQRPGGVWTSKLGEREDIDHALRDLEGTAYGAVVLIMKRPGAEVK
jgi:hypothetical protein